LLAGADSRMAPSHRCVYFWPCRRWCIAVAARDSRHLVRAGAGAALGVVSLPSLHWAGVHVVSMGRPAARSRLPGDLLPAVETISRTVSSPGIAHHGVAAAMAAVSADVLFRDGQAAERRPYVAQSDSTQLPLLHAAHPESSGVVYAATAGMDPEPFRRT